MTSNPHMFESASPKKPLPAGANMITSTASALPKQNQVGMQQPYAILPIKSKAFALAAGDNQPLKGASLVKMMQSAEPRVIQAVDELIAWTGIENLPLSMLAPVIPVCGSTGTASAIAMAMVRYHDADVSNRKIALLEWGQPQATLMKVLDLNAPMIGLNELFSYQCDLTHLILNAKVHRPIPQLYAIGQGTGPLNPMENLLALGQLMAALSKKFHRIVLSLPSLDSEPRLPEMLNRLRLPYGLFYDPEETVFAQLYKIRKSWPGSTIQRLT